MTEYTFFPDRPVANYRKSDSVFIVCTLLLWGIGIFTLYVCSPGVGERFFGNKNYFLNRQIVSSVVGFAGLIFFAVVPLRTIRRFVFAFAVVSFVLCVMASLPGIGSERKGASRWIVIPHLFSFQPSELVKFAVVLYLAHMFDAHSSEYEESSREFIYPVAALLLFVIAIFCQRNLSTGIFVFALGVAMFVLSGASLKWLLPFSVLAVPAAAILVTMEEYRLIRILAYLFPEKFKFSAGYQVSASERAISAGGIWGTGIGEGLEKISLIPEIQTDYIFAGWATMMGLFGVTSYFILLAVFSYRGFKIALSCPDRFAAYGAFGCTLCIFCQSVFNCAVVCGACPTTGIPLPFFSSGGSSLIMTLCMCGFIINASHCDADKDSGRKSENSLDNVETIGGVVVEYE
ncbi:peptidoglycan glycosyltransferase FtsW [Treponema sp.]|uniref:peptidoglycan glycosyltransferase FtsW n=1 Tax=Treponema sp. TaxID=166 RepID=UPI003F0A02AA